MQGASMTTCLGLNLSGESSWTGWVNHSRQVNTVLQCSRIRTTAEERGECGCGDGSKVEGGRGQNAGSGCRQEDGKGIITITKDFQ